MGNKTVFESLFEVNVNEHIEKKDGLSYLSWPYAWAEVKKKFPNATYKIRLFGENQLPYIFDENVGYMVFTEVTIEGLTHMMWLPVLNGSNKTMKSESYTYDTRFKKGIQVEAATMFDINKAIMRCLVKNLAMFGLGLYIYSGEDLPEIEVEKISAKDATILKNVVKHFDEADKLYMMLLEKYKVRSFKELTVKQRTEILEGLNQLERNHEIKSDDKIYDFWGTEGQTKAQILQDCWQEHCIYAKTNTKL